MLQGEDNTVRQAMRYLCQTAPGEVHRCGPVGSMRACQAAGPDSIPGRDKFPGWDFSGFIRICKTNVRKI